MIKLIILIENEFGVVRQLVVFSDGGLGLQRNGYYVMISRDKFDSIITKAEEQKCSIYYYERV